MSFIIADRVRESSSTQGAGTITMTGSQDNYQTFSSAVGTGNTCRYCIVNSNSTDQWEVGLGTITVSGITTYLSRDTIEASSNLNAVVTLTAGTKTVTLVFTAAELVSLTSIDAQVSAQIASVDARITSVNANVVHDPGGNGFVVRTAQTSSVNRTLTAGTFVTITNGSGVSGNPVIDFETSAGDGRYYLLTSGQADAAAITSINGVVTSVNTYFLAAVASVQTNLTSTNAAVTSVNTYFLAAVASVQANVTSINTAVPRLAADNTFTSINRFSGPIALIVSGTATFSSVVANSGALNQSGASTFTAAVCVTQPVTFTGLVSGNNGLTWSGAVCVTGAETLTAAVCATNTFTLTGAVSGNNTLTWSGATSITGANTFTGITSTTNLWTYTSAVSATGPFTFTGAVSGNNTFTWSGALSATGAATFTGAVCATNTFNHTGANTFAVTAIVSGLDARGAIWGNPFILTDAASIAVNFAAGINFVVTLTANRVLEAPTNVNPGQSGVITINQNNVGSKTLSYNTAWKFPGGTAPTLSTSVSSVDILSYYARTATFIVAQLAADFK